MPNQSMNDVNSIKGYTIYGQIS